MGERRFVVSDADGMLLGSFADFDSAHAWGHAHVAEHRAAAPLTVDDHRERVSRRLWPERCELVAWAEFAVLRGCDLRSLARPA